MQSKLCLVLAFAVIVGALAGGNPFLCHGAAAPLRAVKSPGAVDVAPAVPSVAEPSPGGSGVQLVSLRSGAALPAAGLQPIDRELCPDVQLRELVVRVLHDFEGRPIWLLRDGRRVRANPRPGPGQPAVLWVEVAPGGDKSGGDKSGGDSR